MTAPLSATPLEALVDAASTVVMVAGAIASRAATTSDLAAALTGLRDAIPAARAVAMRERHLVAVLERLDEPAAVGEVHPAEAVADSDDTEAPRG